MLCATHPRVSLFLERIWYLMACPNDWWMPDCDHRRLYLSSSASTAMLAFPSLSLLMVPEKGLSCPEGISRSFWASLMFIGAFLWWAVGPPSRRFGGGAKIRRLPLLWVEGVHIKKGPWHGLGIRSHLWHNRGGYIRERRLAFGVVS